MIPTAPDSCWAGDQCPMIRFTYSVEGSSRLARPGYAPVKKVEAQV